MFRPSPNPLNNASGEQLRLLLQKLKALRIPVEKVTAEYFEHGPLVDSRPVDLNDLPAEPQEYTVFVHALGNLEGGGLNAGRLVRIFESRLTPYELVIKLFGQVYPTSSLLDWFSHSLTLPAIRKAYETEIETILS